MRGSILLVLNGPHLIVRGLQAGDSGFQLHLILDLAVQGLADRSVAALERVVEVTKEDLGVEEERKKNRLYRR